MRNTIIVWLGLAITLIATVAGLIILFHYRGITAGP